MIHNNNKGYEIKKNVFKIKKTPFYTFNYVVFISYLFMTYP